MPKLLPPLCRVLVIGWAAVAAGCASVAPPGGGLAGEFDVRRYGATGDGTTLDTAAINAAIAAAHAAGGGTVVFPAGRYACHSVHLMSHVTLRLGAGATLAAAPPSAGGGYDAPEPNAFDAYQDFGHDHFHNALVWGEHLVDVGIVGPGTIDGTAGLARGFGGDADPGRPGAGMGGVGVPRYTGAAPKVGFDPRDVLRPGLADKAIALKLCRQVTLRGFALRGGGHLAVLATGVDDLTVEDVRVDTNRDGFDIDSCRGVRVSDCAVNSPYDDGICLKADFALGYARPCEDVTITGCQVSAWSAGSMLDGTFLPVTPVDGAGGWGTGRIKFGTESNGGFVNIAISNCVFDHCRGLALETVDGGRLEDVAIDNVTMRHPVNSPIFLRLGGRLRGPPGTPVGTLQRVSISNVVVYDADPRFASIIAGLPGQPVRDVTVSHCQIFARGGGEDATETWATTRPAELAEKYPEPGMFGPTPAYGFYVRHADGVRFVDVQLHVARDDLRPAFVLDDVTGAAFSDVSAETAWGVPPVAALTPTTRMTVHDFPGATTEP